MIAVIKPKIITPVGWRTNKLILKENPKREKWKRYPKKQQQTNKDKNKILEKNKMYTRPIKICSHVALPL